jgi:hypothetical protein
MVVKEIGRCAAKGEWWKPRIRTSRAMRRWSPMSRFGIDEAVDLALAGATLLRFENVLEIDFQSLSGLIWVITKAQKHPAPERFRTLGVRFRN